jgi:hypothetical protein
MTGTQTYYDPARTRTSSPAAAQALVQRAADSARKHRHELLILAGTVAFVVIVAVLSLAALTG